MFTEVFWLSLDRLFVRRSLPIAIIVMGWSIPALAQQNMLPNIMGGFGAIINQAIRGQQQQQYYQNQQYYQQQQQQQMLYNQQQIQLQQQRIEEENREAEYRRQKRAAAAAAAKKIKDQKPPPAAVSTPQANGTLTVAMTKKNGTFEIPVRLNDVVTIYFTIDSGAADVVLPEDVAKTLIRSGTVKDSDFIDKQTYTLADGSRIQSPRFKLENVQVGDQHLNNVVVSIISDRGTPLLGQSFLSRFASWTLDNTAGTLTLALSKPPMDTKVPAEETATGGPASHVVQASAATAAPVSGKSPGPGSDAAGDRQDDDKPAGNDPSQPTAVAAAQSSHPGGEAAAGAGVPTFPSQTPYAEARHSLMALGYGPVRLPDVEKCDQSSDGTCFPERESCNSGACKYYWRRGDTIVQVETSGTPPTVSEVHCQTNCK